MNLMKNIRKNQMENQMKNSRGFSIKMSFLFDLLIKLKKIQ